jgi:hypothetical protein
LSDYRGKDVTIKDFKLKILICYNSFVVEPLTPNNPYLPPFLYWIEQFLLVLEALEEGLQTLIEL